MGILKRNGFLLLLGIISNLSFAQKEEFYTRGFHTIIFHNDSTFLYKITPICGMLKIDNDTINYGTYIKEKKYYRLTDALVEDSVKIVPIINKKKIMLNDDIFLEWESFYKKENRNLQKNTYRHILKRYKTSIRVAQKEQKRMKNEIKNR